METEFSYKAGLTDRIKGGVGITAIIVTFNEQKYLKASLESLRFSDQLIVVDLGSEDSSVSIARDAGAELLFHGRVPIVEKVREYALGHARHDWVVFLDPDEVIPEALAGQIKDAILKNPDAAIIRVPRRFFFKEKLLNCCVWGVYDTVKTLAIHRDRASLKPYVHRGFELSEGFREVQVPPGEDNFIRHYWMSSYGQLIEKHLRYIEEEGESRYSNGHRFSWRRMLGETLSALKVNLLDCRGLYGGFTCIFLSFFYGWYVFMSCLSLRRYEHRVKGKKESVH